jgi:hypothetical protein
MNTNEQLISIGEYFLDCEVKVVYWGESFEGWAASLHGAFCPCTKCGVPTEYRCHEGCCDPENLTIEWAQAIEAAMAAAIPVIEVPE